MKKKRNERLDWMEMTQTKEGEREREIKGTKQRKRRMMMRQHCTTNEEEDASSIREMHSIDRTERNATASSSAPFPAP
jgi:hypothetical protein